MAVLGQVAEFKDGDIGVLRVGTPRNEKLIENSMTTSSWQRKALKLEGSGTHRVRVEYPWYKELSQNGCHALATERAKFRHKGIL